MVNGTLDQGPGQFWEEIQEAWPSFLRKWISSMADTKSQIKITTIPLQIDYLVVLYQMGKKDTNASHVVTTSESHDKARIEENLRQAGVSLILPWQLLNYTINFCTVFLFSSGVRPSCGSDFLRGGNSVRHLLNHCEGKNLWQCQQIRETIRIF